MSEGGDLGGGVEALQRRNRRWANSSDRPGRAGDGLAALAAGALGLLQTRRTAIKHHDQICGAT